MAELVEISSLKNGYREPGIIGHDNFPPSSEILTSDAHNDVGLDRLRTWPKIYKGTNTPHDLPEWWKPRSKVDVLICVGKILLTLNPTACPNADNTAAGPAGLQSAPHLARQGVSFRILQANRRRWRRREVEFRGCPPILSTLRAPTDAGAGSMRTLPVVPGEKGRMGPTRTLTGSKSAHYFIFKAILG